MSRSAARDLLVAGTQLDGQRRQLGVPLVELRGAVPQHLLDGTAQPPGLLLAPLEIGDRRLQLLGALLDLTAALDDERLDRLLVVGGAEERLEPMPDPVVGGPPAGPVLPVAIFSRMSLHDACLPKWVTPAAAS